MADVFISYKSEERTLPEALATDLQAAGYSVWWDVALVGGPSFREQILGELDAARAVIVIWTPASVRSEFVLDEAERAKALNKLIPLRARELPLHDLPLGHGQAQTYLVDDRERIYTALSSRDIHPKQLRPVSFDSLCRRIYPLLHENSRIFNDFGPNSGASEILKIVRDESKLKLWHKRRGDVVKNNSVIAKLIFESETAIPEHYKSIFRKWLSHIEAFELHVADASIDYREHLFPKEVDKIVREHNEKSYTELDRIECC